MFSLDVQHIAKKHHAVFVTLQIPAFLMYNHDIDWKYKTRQTNDSCLAFTNNRCTWSKGKAMGGSSAINAMLYVRGHPRDYQLWKEAGNPGWGYDELIPYFEAIEKKFNFESYKYHENPWYNILKSTYGEIGLSNEKVDKNEALIGTRITKLVTQDGKRLNSAKIYLKENKKLFIMRNSAVQKVIIDRSTLKAEGVELRYKGGKVIQIQAKKEVILSAGSVATPHILMLSGIGPRPHLNDIGIDCLLDLPVGHNLQDHIILPLLFKTKLQIQITPEEITSTLIEYMLKKTGPLSNIGLTDFMSFINTNNDSDCPNIQFHHVYFTKNDYALKSFFEGFGYGKETVDTILKMNKLSDLLGINPTLLHPKSKGKIQLNYSNPLSSPDIVTNYLRDAEDMKTLVEGIRYATKLLQTETFKSLEIDFFPIELSSCKDFLLDSDEYWECYIRNLAGTIFHPVGTAKMGPKEDATAVVNCDLMVHGMRNLRIVDASIMPNIPSGNTMAPTLVIAEKAFDIIKKYYSYKDEL